MEKNSMSVKVSAESVKKLRDRTGVSMGKCKEALDQAGGDMEKAIDILRTAGMASAVKKEGREANEGLVGFAESSQAVAIIEVNSETDFVAQNAQFKVFLQEVCEEAARSQISSVEELLKLPYSKDSSITLDQHRALTMQSLGENIQVKRVQILQKSSTRSIGLYSHMGGKIVSAVILEGATGQEGFAREIAMHVAAESPDYLAPQEVPADVKAREEEIAKAQIQGKPANMVEKIVEGKIKAFYDQVCLVCQKFIKDNAKSVSEVVEAEAKKIGAPLKVQGFVRWKVGG
jgi:elongation factor Ts